MSKVKNFFSFINESGLHIKMHDRGEHVRRLQQSLENLGFPLRKYGIDGIYGPETHAASKETLTAISNMTNLVSIVGDPTILQFAPDGLSQTQYEVAVMVGNKPEMATAIKNKLGTKVEALNTSTDNMAIQSLIKKNVPDHATFMPKLNQVSKYLGINPNWLLAVMYKESKLKATAQNSNTKATGLIQFMPDTAIGLKTTVEALRAMTATQQLDYVQKYLDRWKGKMKSVIDVYLSVFYPVAIGKPDTFVIGSQVSPEKAKEIALRNPAISNGKPVISKSDFKAYVTKDLPADLAAAV